MVSQQSAAQPTYASRPDLPAAPAPAAAPDSQPHHTAQHSSPSAIPHRILATLGSCEESSAKTDHHQRPGMTIFSTYLVSLLYPRFATRDRSWGITYTFLSSRLIAQANSVALLSCCPSGLASWSKACMHSHLRHTHICPRQESIVSFPSIISFMASLMVFVHGDQTNVLRRTTPLVVINSLSVFATLPPNEGGGKRQEAIDPHFAGCLSMLLLLSRGFNVPSSRE